VVIPLHLEMDSRLHDIDILDCFDNEEKSVAVCEFEDVIAFKFRHRHCFDHDSSMTEPRAGLFCVRSEFGFRLRREVGGWPSANQLAQIGAAPIRGTPKYERGTPAIVIATTSMPRPNGSRVDTRPDHREDLQKNGQHARSMPRISDSSGPTPDRPGRLFSDCCVF
jgi:hypothetical protein